MIQLDFFQSDETLILKDKIRLLKEAQDKQRKALFAKNGELQKKYDDLLERMDVLERHICQNK